MDVLPAELWHLALSFVEYLSDVFALCHSSKRLRALAFDAVVVLRSPRPVLLRTFFRRFPHLTRTQNIVLELDEARFQPSLVDTAVRIASPIFGRGGRQVSTLECGGVTLQRRTEKIVELLARPDGVVRISISRVPVEYVFIDNGAVVRWTNYDVPRMSTVDDLSPLFRTQLLQREPSVMVDCTFHSYALVNPLAVQFFRKVGLYRFAEHVSSGMCLVAAADVMARCIEKYGMPLDIYGPIEEDIENMCGCLILRRKRRSAPVGALPPEWKAMDPREVDRVVDRMMFLHPTHRHDIRGMTDVEMLGVRLPRKFPPEGCLWEIEIAVAAVNGR